ncbi:MAG: hypothetical protein Q9157_004115 [Trypethelium eluteriae]
MAAELPQTQFTALVTGANSGLGFAIACRLITEFLETRPLSETLILIVTTRSTRKSDDTVSRLQLHVDRTVRKSRGQSSEKERPYEYARIKLKSEIVDLTSIISVQQLAQRLQESAHKIDTLILNAGIGGWTGVNWLNAVWTVSTDWVHATTWPTMKIAGKGWLAKPQLAGQADGKATTSSEQRQAPGQEDVELPLGEVFTANVFGHYLLAHYTMPLLSTTAANGIGGKIIWISSIEAHARALNLDDFQALDSHEAYESSKRVTDILALTYGMPATRPWVSQFTSTVNDSSEPKNTSPPKMYVTHPGVCGTAIFPLPYLLNFLMTLTFYVSRWLGSPWHTCDPYLGATAAVWIALTPQSQLDATEERDGIGKWGVATDRLGNERVAKTEVEGWGWGGRVGEPKRKGRKRGVQDLTEEQREGFVELGRDVWRRMEEMRNEWEEKLPPARWGLKL